MSFWFDLGFLRIFVAGVLVAVLGLAGCGRKGGLDPPPTAAVDPNVAAGAGPPPGIGPDGKALAPAQGPRRPTPIDWLIE